MCGRFTLATPGEVVAEVFSLDEVPELTPRWNICPSEAVAVVRTTREGARTLDFLHWGLVPAWASDPSIGARTINARAESAADKPAFRDALRRRRCLIVADGFYEWADEGRVKQPHHIRLKSGRPFGIAGLWERWGPAGAEPLESCTILTTVPNELLAPLHDRMPVVLGADRFDAWLDRSMRDPARLAPLLAPFDAAQMKATRVSRRVSSPANDDEDCIRPEPGP